MSRHSQPRKSQRPQRPVRPGPAGASSGPAVLVQIEKPIYGGAFLARHEGKALFVPLALPGEEERVRIVENRKSYATAEIDSLITPSPLRIPPACPHFALCGGCSYQHTSYENQLQLKLAILRETLDGGELAVGRVEETPPAAGATAAAAPTTSSPSTTAPSPRRFSSVPPAPSRPSVAISLSQNSHSSAMETSDL